MDDQDTDPIAEALSAVSAQFAGSPPPSAAATLDAAGYDDETDDASPSDETDADADETDDESPLEAESTEPTINWDDESNPYRTQAMQAAQRVQQFETAVDLVRRINAARAAEAEEANAQALIAQLNDVDPEMAQQYHGQRTGLIQRTAAAEQEKVAWTHSMAAMHLAMKEYLDDETLRNVVALGEEIVRQPGLDGMMRHIENKRQAKNGANAEVEQLKARLQQALLQAEARGREPAADRVDSAPSPRTRIRRPEDTDNMDDFMTALAPSLHFGR